MKLRLNLHLRLGIIYFSAVLFFGIAAYLTARAFTFVTLEANAVIGQDAPVIRGLGNVRQEVDEAVKSSRIAMAGQISTGVARDKINVVTHSLEELRKSSLPEESPFLDTIESDWNAIVAALDRMKVTPSHIGSIFQKEILPLLGDLGQAIYGMENARRLISFERVQKIQQDIQQARRHLLLFVSLLVLTGAGLAWGVRRYVLRPLSILTRATDRVARGDFDHQILPLHNDEIGDLMTNFNTMNMRLAKSEQMKKEFVSLVAHEMRTPLTVIRGYVELLVDPKDNSSEKEKREYWEAINRETMTLQELIEDLFDVARANAGSFSIEPVLTDMAQALTDFLKSFEPIAAEKKILFTWDVSKLPKAVVDVKRVGQALRNLVSNAFKFTAAGGQIDVKGKLQKDEMVMEVTDNGPGIPPAELDNIFTRYYQVKVKEGQARGGTGLGLAIVREIALAHGGRAEVASEMGKGTRFRFILPNKLICFMLIGFIMMGCATSNSSSKAAKLERQGQLVQAAQLQEQIASEHTGKVAAKAWYRAGSLWMDPDNPQKSFKRALTCFNRVDRSKVDHQTANNTRLWISLLTQLASAKQKASTLKETAAALKDAAAGSERLRPPTPTPPPQSGNPAE